MKNFRKLGKEEMKNVQGGNSVVCPEGLCFNSVIQACDWPSNGNCDDDAGDSPKVAACRGKKRYDDCYFDYHGTTYQGRCDSQMASELYCSTLL